MNYLTIYSRLDLRLCYDYGRSILDFNRVIFCKVVAMSSDSFSRVAVAGMVAGAAATAFVGPLQSRGAVTSSPVLRGSQAPSSTSGVTLGTATLGTAALAAVATSARKHGRSSRAAKVVRQQAAPAVAERKQSDLTGALPDCPSTIWNADDIDIKKLPPVKKTAPLIIDAAELGDELKKGTEKEWVAAQKDKIMSQLQDHGAIWFRNFESTKGPDGFREFYEALQLNPCLDPIHTSGLRAMEEKKHAVYEAVNKPSLAGHFVGLHNESTFVKTATYGAFVCFQKASEGGGEFLIADGAKILEDMDKDVLERIYTNKVRISVSNLDLNFLGSLPEGMKESASDFLQDLIFKVVAPKFDMDLEMVYGADGSNPHRLQAIEHAQSPINKHPVTGQTCTSWNIMNSMNW